MSEQLRESLSALMDGEAEELEVRRLLAHSDTEMINHSWVGFHRTRDVMAGQAGDFSHLDISSRVSAAIAEEPALSQAEPAASKGRFWLRPLAGTAVAASVMMAVVIGVRGFSPQQPGVSAPTSVAQVPVASRVFPATSTPAAVSGDAGVAVSAHLRGAGPGGQAAADLAAQQRLEKYMLRHTEHAALNSGEGLMSFARVASFEVE